MELVRENVQAGFGFCIGNTEDNQFIITKIAPGGASDGKLIVGDQVVSVNGSSTSYMAHKDIVDEITAVLRCNLNVLREEGSSFEFEIRLEIDRQASVPGVGASICKAASATSGFNVVSAASGASSASAGEEDPGYAYYKGLKGLFPLRSTAPESMKKQIFTEASDVYSFAILAIEMFTDGATPFFNVS